MITLYCIGAACNVKDHHGWTPLHVCGFYDSLKCAQLLVSVSNLHKTSFKTVTLVPIDNHDDELWGIYLFKYFSLHFFSVVFLFVILFFHTV